MIEFVVGVAVQLITIFLAWFAINVAIYMGQEINHSVRKFKVGFKEFVWDIEWKWKLFRGR